MMPVFQTSDILFSSLYLNPALARWAKGCRSVGALTRALAAFKQFYHSQFKILCGTSLEANPFFITDY